MFAEPRKYLKKPIQVEAIQYTGKNYKDVCEFANLKLERDDSKLIIPTLEGNMKANLGDFIIKGIRGEIYPCKPSAFFETYEDLEE